MNIYKLYCGRNIPASEKKVTDKEISQFLENQKYFDGFTIWNSTGYWKGEREDTIVIEIVTDDTKSVYSLAKDYKSKFNQESVMIVIEDSKVKFN